MWEVPWSAPSDRDEGDSWMGVGERRIAAAAREPWRERTVARVDLGEEAGFEVV